MVTEKKEEKKKGKIGFEAERRSFGKNNSARLESGDRPRYNNFGVPPPPPLPPASSHVSLAQPPPPLLHAAFFSVCVSATALSSLEYTSFLCYVYEPRRIRSKTAPLPSRGTPVK